MSKWFEIGLNTDKLKSDAQEADKIINNIGKNATSQKNQVTSLIAWQQELARVRSELTNLSKIEATRGSLTQAQIDKQGQLTDRAMELSQAISGLSGNLTNNVKVNTSVATSINDLEQELRQLKDAYSELTAEERSSDFGKELLSKIKSTDSELAKLRGSMGETSFSFRGISNQMRMMTGVFGNLPAGLQKVVVGLNGMTGAARAFIATPLGAIITALVVVIQAFRTWIDKSEKGQLAFAKVSGYLGGILKSLTDIVVKVGDALFDAFTNPKEAVANLWNFIKNNFVNRFVGLVDMFKSVGKIISSGFTSGYEDFGNAIAKVTTGVDDLIGKTVELGKKTNEVAKEGASIKAEENALTKERVKWESEKADLELKSINNAKTKEQIRKRDLELTNKEIALAERKYKQSGSDEDLKALTQLKNSRNSIVGGAVSVSVQKKDYTDELQQQKISLERANRDLELQAWQARINAMPEGLKKTLEANKLAYEREEEQLKRQAEDRLKQIQENEKLIWESKGGMGKFTPTTTELSEKDKLNFDGQLQDAKSKQTLDDLDAQKEALKRFEELSYQVTTSLENDEVRKQNAIKKTYQEMRKSLDEMLNNGDITKEQYDNLIPQIDSAESKAQLEQLIEGVNDYQTRLNKLNDEWNAKLQYDAEHNSGQLAEVILKGQAEAIGALNAEFLTKSDDWQILFGNLESLSVKSLQRLKEKIKEAMKGMNLDPASMKAITDALDKVDKQVSSKNPFAGLAEGIKKYKNASDEASKSDALNLISSNVGALGQMAESIFGEVVGGLQDLGVEMDEETQSLLSGIGEMIGGATQLAQGILTGNPIDIVAGGIKLLTSAINVFDGTSRKANRTIRANEKELDNLDKAYRRLERTVNETYGSEKAEHIEQMKRLKQAQQELLKANILAEKSKKKPDKEKIKAWENEIVELGYQIEDLGKDAKDAIYGEDIKSAIENFANAYADAWSKGENRMKASKDVVKNMIRQMIMTALNSDIDKPMEALRAKLLEFWADGIISPEDEAELQRRAEEITKGLDDKYSWADRFMKDGQSQGSATYGAYEKITQDQASLIDGRLTGIHMETVNQSQSLVSIDKSVFEMSINFAEMKNIALDSWQELTDINKNTKQLYEMNERLGKIEKNTQNL